MDPAERDIPSLKYARIETERRFPRTGGGRSRLGRHN